MIKRRLSRVLISLLAASGISASIFILDSKHSSTKRADMALRWAKQIASQAEALSLYARERKERDPIGWAVRYLILGPEPRFAEIFTLSAQERGSPSEKYLLDRNGLFSYAKVFDSETGRGVKINIQLGYIGLFGMGTRWKSDLLLGVMLLLFSALFFLTAEFIRPTQVKSSEEMKLFTLKWVVDAKTTLTQLGLNVRNMTRSAQSLVLFSRKSQTVMEKVEHNSSAEDVLQVAQEMNQFISQTIETVLVLVKMLENLKRNAESSQKAQDNADSIK